MANVQKFTTNLPPAQISWLKEEAYRRTKNNGGKPEVTPAKILQELIAREQEILGEAQTIIESLEEQRRKARVAEDDLNLTDLYEDPT